MFFLTNNDYAKIVIFIKLKKKQYEANENPL